jgi:hypothetical protein
MKKKLNFFCVLILLLMAAQVVITFFLGADDFAEGWRKGASEVHPTMTLKEFIDMLLCLAVLVAAIVSFVCFFRFIVNVNRNKVFEWGNVLLLRITGLGLLVFALLGSAEELLNDVSLEEVYEDFYEILIFCVFNLIVAEVFAIGLKLKEEQDLTI